ncbi:MAG: hypothetical protein EPO07_17680 [Verrucomicrobia bacterium]|nr:MAG: hypothetical protein EPO07_17680 [Verrucomicrobiota bacterium]
MKKNEKRIVVAIVVLNFVWILFSARVVWYYHRDWDLSSPKIKRLTTANPEEYLKGRQEINEELLDDFHYYYIPPTCLGAAISSYLLLRLLKDRNQQSSEARR